MIMKRNGLLVCLKRVLDTAKNQIEINGSDIDCATIWSIRSTSGTTT